MQVSHFIVPAEAYPRYRYNRKHAIPLFDRFHALLTECGIKDPYPKPEFGEVDIYVVFKKDSKDDLIKDADLPVVSKQALNIKQTDFQRSLTPDELRNQCARNKACIFIASYSQTQKDPSILEAVDGDIILIIDDELKAETPECQTVGKVMLTVEKKSLSQQIGLLLERIILREFRERLSVLTAFKGVDTQHFFEQLESDVKNAIESRRPSSSSVAPLTTFDMMKKYYQTKREMIERQINTYYKKDLPLIREQLLRTCVYEGASSLTICEAIQSLADGFDQAARIQAIMPEVESYNELSKVNFKAVLLENRVKEHLKLLGANMEEVENLWGEIVGLFRRSKVPEFERPDYNLPVLSQEAVADILAVEGVTGCGYRYTTLDIFFLETVPDVSRDHLTAVMAKHEIDSFRLMTEQKHVNYTNVGAKVTGGSHNLHASVGGFAKNKKKELCLLLARHFADLDKKIHLREANGSKRLIAQVLERRIVLQCPLDIAAAGVEKKVQGNVETRFKTEEGDYSSSRLVRFGAEETLDLTALPVHLWGATSSPGVGIITNPTYYVPGTNMPPLVRIQDRRDKRPIERFARGGDSGAIVCAEDPDGAYVHVISMMMGSPLDNVAADQPKEYTTLRLHDGLRQLGEEHNTTFELC